MKELTLPSSYQILVFMWISWCGHFAILTVIYLQYCHSIHVNVNIKGYLEYIWLSEKIKPCVYVILHIECVHSWGTNSGCIYENGFCWEPA